MAMVCQNSMLVAYAKRRSMSSLDDQLGVFGAGFAAVDGGFGAPFGGEAADAFVGFFVEAQEVADDAAVEEGAVGVGIRQVGRLKLFVSELVEDRFCRFQLIVAKGTEVQHSEGFSLSNCYGSFT